MAAPEKHAVVVVGAGLSGLHAAGLLDAAGVDVLVVEAQERIGGRIHSMRQLGPQAEAGGTFIGAGYERVFAIAERAGIRLIDVTPLLEFFREQDLVLDGEIIRQSDWPDHPSNPFPNKDRAIMPWNYHRVLTAREMPFEAPGDWIDPAFSKYDIPVHAWMRSLGLTDEAIRIGYDMNPSFGRDANDVSTLLLFFRAAFSKAQRAKTSGGSIGFTVEHGVQRLPEAMAAGLSRRVRTQHVVRAITSDATAARIDCENGQAFAAETVVVAVPPGALNRIALEPPLPLAQSAALASLPAQPVTQVYLRPKSPFWEADGYAPSLFTNTPCGMLAAVRDRDKPTDVTHLTAWVMGPEAARLDALSTADAARRVIESIERLRPAARGRLELLGMKSWGRDPYSFGAWAYFRPGQVGRCVRVLGNAHGRVHFCGEHLALSGRGMEGALETAESVVTQLCADR